MASDIKLDGEWVVVEGTWTRVRTLDLMLDAPERRQNEQGWRRALVHNQQDGLTINSAGDYPGGVTIQGQVRMHEVHMTGALQATSACVEGELEAQGAVRVRGRMLVRVVDAGTNTERLVLSEPNAPTPIEVEGRGMQINGGLHVRGEAYFDQTLRVRDVLLGPPPGPGPLPPTQHLQQVIADFSAKVAQLEARIAALEARS
jgi:hypothetical protein